MDASPPDERPFWLEVRLYAALTGSMVLAAIVYGAWAISPARQPGG